MRRPVHVLEGGLTERSFPGYLKHIVAALEEFVIEWRLTHAQVLHENLETGRRFTVAVDQSYRESADIITTITELDL